MKTIITTLLFLMALVVIVPTLPAQTNPNTPKMPEVKPPLYPVILGDRTIFNVRSIEGFLGEERANTAAERIKKTAEDLRVPVSSIQTITYQKPMTAITAGNTLLLAVFEEDAKGEGGTREELAADYSQRLRRAIEQYRHEHSRRQVLFGALYTALATTGLLFLLFLIIRSYGRLSRKFLAYIDARRVSLHFQSFEIIRAERIKTLVNGVAKILRLFVILMLLYAYVRLCLGFFPWTQSLSASISDFLTAPLAMVGKAILAQLPNLFFIVVIVVITTYVLKLTRLFFNALEAETIAVKGFYAEWAQPTYKIVRILAIAFAAVVAFPFIPGSESPAFKGVSIFFGVLFSLGSTSAVANILAGYALVYRRLFKVGDRVKIGEFIGDVVNMRLQVVHLRTIKNEEITVPSSVIVNSHVINYSALAKDTGLILHTTVTIGYDTPWRQVEALLLLAAERTSGILREPTPFILQTSLDDFYVSYQLNVYTDEPQAMIMTYTELHRNIQDAFNEYGVQIMSPSYRGDPAQLKVVPPDQWYAAPARKPDNDFGRTPDKG